MRKLYFGMSGSDVKELQMKLESLGYADFVPTSFYGIIHICNSVKNLFAKDV